MLELIIPRLPGYLKTPIKRLVMYAYAKSFICPHTAARLIRDWQLGSV